MQRVSGEAVEALADVMNNKRSPASSRVHFAWAVLELAIKAIELEDLESRLAVLEEDLQRKGDRH